MTEIGCEKTHNILNFIHILILVPEHVIEFVERVAVELVVMMAVEVVIVVVDVVVDVVVVNGSSIKERKY